MKRIFFTVLLTTLLVGALFHLQFVSVQAETYIPPTTKNDLITFKIKDEAGQPVANAGCEFISSHQYGFLPQETVHGTTDVQGYIQFPINRNAILFYSIHVKTSDGQLQKYSETVLRIPKILDPHIKITFEFEDKTLPELVPLELQPARKLKGMVVGPEGNPISNASVEVQGYFSSERIFGLFTLFSSNVSTQTQTDSFGMYTVYLPREIIPSSIYALKDGKGFDYYMVGDPEFPDFKNAEEEDVSLPTITLSGADPLKVRLVDTEGNPVPGLIVTPSSFSPKTGSRKYQSLVVNPEFGAASDSDGFATINWFSHGADIFRSSRPIQVTMPDSSPLMYTHRPDDNYRFTRPDDYLTEVLWKKLPISGTVRDKSGSPVAGTQVNVYPEKTRFSLPWMTKDSALTDENGRYEVFVPHERRYMIKVECKEWVSTTYQDDILLPRNEPVTNMDFIVQKPTRVFGKITEGPDYTLKHTSVELLQFSDPNLAPREFYYKRVEGQPTPQEFIGVVEEGKGKIQKYTILSDENGQYEIFLGPGHYQFYNQLANRGKVFSIQISDENKDYEMNFNITGGK